MAKTNTTQAIESLAAEIGNNVYMDIAKWHLYLREAHLHTMLAERIYPMLEDKSLDESKVLEMLENIPVKIGGKRDIPLADLIPTASQVNLMDILEEFQRNI